MIPGIDPKIDIAFKKVFGSDASRELTKALINAVLDPLPGQRLEELELLNPYSDKMTLDDKLSILDIKARDERGRLYNVEMQMLAIPSLPQRFLYYWSKMYSQQLVEADDYSRLRPTISICFVNGDVFADRDACHSRFRLLEEEGRLILTADLAIHVIEIPKFRLDLEGLQKPLDFWLYFLKNGIDLDADALPRPLAKPEICRAMEVLKMFSQNEMERELYEGRLKEKRDRRMFETRVATAERELDEAIRERDEVARERDEVARERDEVARERDEAALERDEARHAMRLALVDRIQLCERLLKQPKSDVDELLERSEEDLRKLADRLEQQLTHSSE